MKKILILSLLGIAFLSFSQTRITGTDASLFSIKMNKNDTVNFIVTDTTFTQKKPIIVFLQGSRPIPIVIHYKANYTQLTFLANFNYRNFVDKYNFVIVSKPHVPVIAEEENLNSDYESVPDLKSPQKYLSEYLNDNYLEMYVKRTSAVIDFLRKQKWVDKSNISLVGHSEGALVAISTYEQKPKQIKTVGFLSGSVDGAFSIGIVNERKQQFTKKKNALDTQNQINEYWNAWKDYAKGIDNYNYGKAYLKSWTSISRSFREDLIKMKKPLFLAYGTEDYPKCIGYDPLPLYFELEGKSNYKMYPIIGGNHNFDELDSNGQFNGKSHWTDVMTEFTKWVESLDQTTVNENRKK
jgi:pimeloyl-ACP methyl ester carboxylesterase